MRGSEEARGRARQIRDKALARLDAREGLALHVLVEECAALRAEITAQRHELAVLADLIRSLSASLAAPSAPLPRPSVPRPLSTEKRMVLERIRELRRRDLSFSQICTEFLNQGVPTLSGEGEWSKGTLWNLWKNHSHQLDFFE